MKIKTLTVFVLCLFYISPLSADYSKMTKDRESYSPPEYYSDSLEQQLEGNRQAAKPDAIFGSISSRIKALKLEFEKKISRENKISFLSDRDTAAYSQLANISVDQKAVVRLVGKYLKLHEIEVIAGLRNPAVLAAQKKVTAQLESFNQVMDLDENLKQYSAFTEGINNKIGPLKMKESLKQKYPYPGLTSLKGGIIQQQAAISVEKMRIVQKNIITKIRKAYWDMVFIERAIWITSETIDAFNRLKDVATILYKSGKTSFQDIIKINIKIEILKEDLVTLSSKRKNIEVKIRELLNLPFNTKLGTVVLTEPNNNIPLPETLYPLARQNRQELKVIQHQILKVQNMIEMAESMIQEPFTLNFSANEDEAVNSVGTGAKQPSFPEKTMAAMKNNHPLKPWYGVDDPWLNQTRQNLLALKQALIKQENATDRMVRDAWFMADKNKRELMLYKNRILPLSKSALDVSTREYEAGSIPFSQAIGSYAYWLKVKLTIAKKQTGFGASVATLEKMIGKSF